MVDRNVAALRRELKMRGAVTKLLRWLLAPVPVDALTWTLLAYSGSGQVSLTSSTTWAGQVVARVGDPTV
jgi:hypothetical protein